MPNKHQIVHDLALVYAQEHYHEFLRHTPEANRVFPTDASKLADLYERGVLCLVNQADALLAAYLDDDGRPILDG